MNFKYFTSIMAGALMAMTTACSPDEFNLGDVAYTPDDLVVDKAFTVTPDAENPNIIRLTSLVKGCTPVWDTPSGRSQAGEMTLKLPFSGDYTVTFGVMTGAGTVWGNPYTFNVGQNDFTMLTEEIWTNLAGGVDENGVGNPKTWVPVDKSYGVGRCTGPVMYLDPEHVNNDGVENADLMFGSANWTPNWDPGFQDWLIPATDPYMNSYMTFGLDAMNGCTLEMKRETAAGGSEITGGFVLKIDDPTHPTITFTQGTYALHNEGFDGTCDNYVNDIKILECTPYLLQLATYRTNSEGPWWIVWNFIAKDVKDGIVTIPTEGPDLLETVEPVAPSYDNLEEMLFTIVGDDATYVATQNTYLMNEEAPYDYYWWNGTVNPSNGILNGWQAQNAYNTIIAPAYEGVEDFALTLVRASGKATIDTATGSFETTFTVGENSITFADEVTLMTAGDIAATGREFTVLKCSPDNEELVLGVPAGTNNNGTVNKYLCVNLKPKAIGGAQTGPVTVPVDNSKIAPYLEKDTYLRIPLYVPEGWGGKPDGERPIDPEKLKLKKGQKLVLKLKIEGVEWSATPKVAICCNMDGYAWEPDCFSNFQAIDLNTTGETTLTLTNETGAVYKFADNESYQISVQYVGFTETPAENAVVTVTSLTIE